MTSSPASHARYVARQPILDARQRVVAYELLFRAGLEEVFACDSPDMATSSVIADSFAVIGIEALTGGKPAFLNFTREALLQDFASLLPPDLVVVELLETIEPDDEVLGACRRLKANGYRIALDDFVWSDQFRPLLELADIVKVDFLVTRGQERAALARKLREFDVTLLAEKVELRSDFAAGIDAGYAWFQGFFFARPNTVIGRDVHGYLQSYVQILEVVNSPNCNLRDVEEVVRRDVSLCLKLLRVANSAAFGKRGRVESIHHALSMLGDQEVRKWVALLTLAGLAQGKPAELIRTTLVRARFCEEIADQFGLGARSTDLFLVGLFSLLDAVLDRPMQDVLAEIPLAKELADAVRFSTGPLAGPLLCAVAWERGDWNAIDLLLSDRSADGDALVDVYVRAVEWARACGEGLAR